MPDWLPSVTPILFSTPMVRAILSGAKTETRRILKPQPSAGVRLSPFVKSGVEDGHGCEIKIRWCIGDMLWVRETALPDFPKEFSYYDWTWAEVPDEYRKPDHVLYKASWTGSPLKWKPSIHMPRWASRITLEVTGVRIERVQAITDVGAIAEGVGPLCHPEGRPDLTWVGSPQVCRSPAYAYQKLWNTINGPASWTENPFVAVIQFKRIANA